jgi:hypothetical protein
MQAQAIKEILPKVRHLSFNDKITAVLLTGIRTFCNFRRPALYTQRRVILPRFSLSPRLCP